MHRLQLGLVLAQVQRARLLGLGQHALGFLDRGLHRDSGSGRQRRLQRLQQVLELLEVGQLLDQRRGALAAAGQRAADVTLVGDQQVRCQHGVGAQQIRHGFRRLRLAGHRAAGVHQLGAGLAAGDLIDRAVHREGEVDLERGHRLAPVDRVLQRIWQRLAAEEGVGDGLEDGRLAHLHAGLHGVEPRPKVDLELLVAAEVNELDFVQHMLCSVGPTRPL